MSLDIITIGDGTTMGLGMEREARQDFEQTLELGLDPFD